MHSCVTSKNAKWCHLIWPTRYMYLVIKWFITATAPRVNSGTINTFMKNVCWAGTGNYELDITYCHYYNVYLTMKIVGYFYTCMAMPVPHAIDWCRRHCYW